MPIKTVFDQKKFGLKVPVKVWAKLASDDQDKKTRDQLLNVARMPFIFKHVAAMPDVHPGYGSTIGSVIATKGAVMPSAVGVDIGCGMMAVETTLDPQRTRDASKKIREGIEAEIPVGSAGNGEIRSSVDLWSGWKGWLSLSDKTRDLLSKAKAQMGSLGGGNHFIEVCEDTEGKIWIMLHSGSRGLGNKVATRHINDAKKLMQKRYIDLPDPDLAYFVRSDPEYQSYLNDIAWIQEYALQNRLEMMSRVLGFFAKANFDHGGTYPLADGMVINCHHNYAEMENHFGENVLVTRKGAVRARKGDLGIVPGSMGTKSFIVEGLGNPESFDSCAHGAGRLMSRGDARRRFTKQDLISQTEGVECPKDEARIDEIPSSYKSITEVMKNQEDLVKVIAELKQFICVKG